jgi:DsbC/DsbD-like thiol-disulfide interchange protein
MLLAMSWSEPAAGQDGSGRATRSDSVVRVALSTGKVDGTGSQEVIVALSIDPGWHLYANPVGLDFPGIPTTLSITGPGKPPEVKVEYPAGRLVRDALAGDHYVYEDTVRIRATVHRTTGATAGDLELNIRMQACNKDKCLLPATVKLKLP